MPTVDLPYVDSALEHLEDGGPPAFWRHLHWGLFSDPEVDDDSPERYFRAAEALTQHVLASAGVADGRRILDVGCGFGGTLDYLDGHYRDCRLVGLNIDVRQMRWARRLLAERTEGEASGEPISFLAADGCTLPVADASLDHVLAIECLFHFPSRRAFFREAARVLRPGGTLALSDFLMAPGALPTIAATMESAGLNESNWYGRSAKPLTPAGYEKLGRGAGFDPLVDDDITAQTLPTYPARRRLYREAGATEGISTLFGVEELATTGGWEYHVLAFRRREARAPRAARAARETGSTSAGS